MLSIVSTPIGNLEDMTHRAVRTLKEADLILAEDTRHSRILLDRYEIATKLRSFHSYSSERDEGEILALLQGGKHLALIADAGTPGISDPGSQLIRTALEHEIPIQAIPGPSAVLTALVLSGLPMHRFLFLGFLPLKKGRKKMIESLCDLPYTVVFYEAPHRIQRALSEFLSVLGNRNIAICREMTKKFEEVYRGNLEGAVQKFELERPRGEFTVVMGAVISSLCPL